MQKVEFFPQCFIPGTNSINMFSLRHSCISTDLSTDSIKDSLLVADEIMKCNECPSDAAPNREKLVFPVGAAETISGPQVEK